jgi:MFS family permease
MVVHECGLPNGVGDAILRAMVESDVAVRPESGTPCGVPFFRLWAGTFGGYVAVGATLQSLPDYLTARFGLGPAGVATTIALASVAAAAMRLPAGAAADRGASRGVVVLGALLGVLGGLGHALAPTVTLLVLARLCLGAGEASLFTGAVAWVIQGTPPTKRGRIAGWFGLSMWAGIATGPFVAVAITRAAGGRAVWTAVTVLPLVALALVATTPRPPAIQRPAHPSPWRLPRAARVPSLAFALASYGYGMIAALLLLRIDAAGLRGKEVALAVFAGVFLLTRALGSPMVDRFGGRSVWLCFGIAEALGLSVIGVGANTTTLLVGVAQTAAGVSLLYPAAVKLVIAASLPSEQGAGMGVLTAAWDVGLLVAGVTGGVVVAFAGYVVAFASSSALVLASVAIISTTRRGT